MRWENVAPHEIEARSFAIITELLGDKKLDPENRPVILRCIHTSADFDYADNLHFSPGIVREMTGWIKQGADIVTDTQMAWSGINKRELAKFGGTVHCFIGDEDVAKEAAERGVTRAQISMERASRLGRDVILAVGNAPTALISAHKLIQRGEWNPKAVIGAPVGFVNVEYAKELLLASDIPCIVARGRKGGSNIAAAIVNAVIYLAANR